jgi:hypothetical protein
MLKVMVTYYQCKIDCSLINNFKTDENKFKVLELVELKKYDTEEKIHNLANLFESEEYKYKVLKLLNWSHIVYQDEINNDNILISLSENLKIKMITHFLDTFVMSSPIFTRIIGAVNGNNKATLVCEYINKLNSVCADKINIIDKFNYVTCKSQVGKLKNSANIIPILKTIPSIDDSHKILQMLEYDNIPEILSYVVL